MKYKQIALSALVLISLIGISFLSVGGCGGGEEGCSLKKSNVQSEFGCELLANHYECNGYKFEGFCPGGFGCFGNSDNCKLRGCKFGCNNGPTITEGFNNPQAIALTIDGDFVVADSGRQAVVHVNRITGDRSILSDANIGIGPGFNLPVEIAMLNDGNFVVADKGLSALVHVDKNTGNRTVISDGSTGIGYGLFAPHGIEVLENGDFIVSNVSSVVYVDHITGNRTLISNDTRGTGPEFVVAESIRVASDGDYVVTNSFTDFVAFASLIKVSPNTGNRVVISDSSIGSGPTFVTPVDIEVNSDREFVVLDRGLDAVFIVDQITGDRTIIFDDSIGIGPSLISPVDLAVDQFGDFIILDNVLDAVVLIDQFTGDRTIISDDKTGSGPSQILSPEPIPSPEPTPDLPPDVVVTDPVLLTPINNEMIQQNNPDIGCPFDQSRGFGWRINFDWTDSASANGINGYYLFVIGSDAVFPIIDTFVPESQLTFSTCNSFIIDSNLNGWTWTIQAEDHFGNLSNVISGDFIFEPCRLDDGTPCNSF